MKKNLHLFLSVSSMNNGTIINSTLVLFIHVYMNLSSILNTFSFAEYALMLLQAFYFFEINRNSDEFLSRAHLPSVNFVQIYYVNTILPSSELNRTLQVLS